jgi:hypothetical protein
VACLNHADCTSTHVDWFDASSDYGAEPPTPRDRAPSMSAHG